MGQRGDVAFVDRKLSQVSSNRRNSLQAFVTSSVNFFQGRHIHQRSGEFTQVIIVQKNRIDVILEFQKHLFLVFVFSANTFHLRFL